MAVNDKLETIQDSLLDLRQTIKSFDSKLGAGAISTLAGDIRTIKNKQYILAVYEDANTGEQKTARIEATSATCPSFYNTGLVNGKLIAVILPSKISALVSNAFRAQNKLEYINIDKVKSFPRDSEFYGCSSLKAITLGSTSGTSCASVGIFKSCTGLKEVTFLNKGYGISFGNNSFEYCDGLEKVRIADLYSYLLCSWGSDTTACPMTYAKHLYDLNDNEITDIVIPNNITTIKASTFCNCLSLQSVVIPNTVTSIGNRAFTGCNNIDTLVIPSSVSSISIVAFGATNFKKLIIDSATLNMGTTNYTSRAENLIINGNVNFSTGTTLIHESWVKNAWINGNVTSSHSTAAVIYNQGTIKNTEFVEINGTIGSILFRADEGLNSNFILHLGYNGIALPSNKVFYGKNMTAAIANRFQKIYVGDGSSEANDQAVLDEYLADSGWAVAVDKLDLWYNYTGKYKQSPIIEVEYLESSGTQYINLPVTCSSSSEFEVSGEGLAIYSDSYTQGNYGVLGANPNVQFSSAYYSRNTSTNIITYDSCVGNQTTNGGWSLSEQTKTPFILSTTTRTLNGVPSQVLRPLTANITSFRIFGDYRHANNASIRFYNFAISVDGVKVMDLIPVKVRGVGYMYDKLTGTLYGNNGTGDFIIGPSIGLVEEEEETSEP